MGSIVELSETPEERCARRRIGALVWIGIIFALAVILFPTAWAVPPARSDRECQLLGDMALVARAFEHHGVAPVLADELMRDIYAGPLERDGKRAWAWITAVRRLAKKAKGISSVEFGSGVGGLCQDNQGNLDVIFGKGTDS